MRSYCDACEAKRESDRWDALPRVEWDGVTPVCTWLDDRYFFDVDDLRSYLGELDLTPETVRLVLCAPDNGPRFDMLEFLTDHLPDEDAGDLYDVDEIDKIVNGWIDSRAPFCWWGTERAVLPESIRRALQDEGTQP
jgi:hypothetical protein